MDTEEKDIVEQKNTDEGASRFLEQVRRYKGYILIGIGLFLFTLAVILLYRAPSEYPVGQTVKIESGQSLQAISKTLYQKHVIVSPLLFRSAVIIFGGEKGIRAGEYLLDVRDGLISLAWRLVKGHFHIGMIKLTIPEGWNTKQISEYLGGTLSGFNAKEFLSLASSQEGYLFPDTYFVSPTASPQEIIDVMHQNFQKKIDGVSDVSSSEHSVHDIITMASILEEEAKTTESRRIISGILWRRIAIDMPLQVDSAFSYVNGKNSYTLTADDLKEDSPYNTYTRKGLPPGPISNPGLDAIDAALNPTKTEYLYFLTGKDGNMYYAKTFEDHIRNKKRYL